MKYDLHIHSKYSHDSMLDPSIIIRIAIKRGLNGVAVTDHNTIRGGIKAKKANENLDFEIIVGSEIKTEYGDIIGLFLNEEIKSRRFVEVIDEIKNQGGFTVLPHPYRLYLSPETIVNHFDLIEGFNARSKTWQNRKACELAKKFNKPIIAGSDAHLSYEIGNGITNFHEKFRNDNLIYKIDIYGKSNNYYITHFQSIFIEKLKNIWRNNYYYKK